MTTIQDLDPCDYFPLPADDLVAVGWLGRDSVFEKGAVVGDFFARLQALAADPWQPFASAGFYTCELCQFEAPRFGDNLFVPFEGKIYVAPAGIVHYIAAHWYKPPAVFVTAVLACPDMGSMAYKKALLSNGGRPLIKAMKG